MTERRNFVLDRLYSDVRKVDDLDIREGGGQVDRRVIIDLSEDEATTKRESRRLVTVELVQRYMR